MAFHDEQLGAFPWTTVRLYCPECHRFAQFSKARLLERFPADYHVHSLMNDLTPCPRVRNEHNICQIVFFDLMPRERRQAAIDRGGLPKGWTAD